MSHINGSAQNGNKIDISNGKVVDGEKFAVTPNSPEQIADLLQQVASHGQSYLVENPQARLKLFEAARALTYAVETPREKIIRHCWAESTGYAALETGVDLNLFFALSKDDRPKTVKELAGVTGADSALLGRLMKHLAAMGAINETGPDEYSRNGFSTAMIDERYSGSIPLMTRRITRGVLAIPEFLKKTNYRSHTSPAETPFKLGHGTDLNFFQLVQQEPLTAKEFNNHMSMYAHGRARWMDDGFYPVRKQLIDGAGIGDQDVLLVDIGGSFGHDLADFRRKWPNVPGRLVLQDLPEVVSSANGLHPSIEVMSHDFFTAQPIKGARAYYMHSVLHDWPDEVCRKILANLTPAMRRGYSKLLINENVIPDTGAYWETTSLDFIMMSVGSSERTEHHWHALLNSCGLNIVNIWTAQRGVESLIECELI